MKFIKRNRVYDTTTARFIGCWYNTMANTTEKIREELYAKKNGEYFLYGTGGANTRYAKNLRDGTFTTGHHCIPMDYPAALLWAQEKLSKKEFEQEFKKYIQSPLLERGRSETQFLTCRIPAAFMAELAYRCEVFKTTRTELIIEALTEYLSHPIPNDPRNTTPPEKIEPDFDKSIFEK